MNRILRSKQKTALGLILLLLTIILSCLSLNAETESLNFRALAWSEKINGDELYFRSSDGQAQELEATNSILSPVYTYTGPEEMTFYKPGPVSNGQPTYTQVGSVKISRKLKDGLLIIVADSNSERYSFLLYPYGNKSFPNNSIQFFNFTNAPIAIVVENMKSKLRPKETFNVPFEYDAQDNNAYFGTIKYQKNNQWVTIFNNWINLGPNTRILIFISRSKKANSVNRNSIKLRTLYEIEGLTEEHRKREVNRNFEIETQEY